MIAVPDPGQLKVDPVGGRRDDQRVLPPRPVSNYEIKFPVAVTRGALSALSETDARIVQMLGPVVKGGRRGDVAECWVWPDRHFGPKEPRRRLVDQYDQQNRESVVELVLVLSGLGRRGTRNDRSQRTRHQLPLISGEVRGRRPAAGFGERSWLRVRPVLKPPGSGTVGGV